MKESLQFQTQRPPLEHSQIFAQQAGPSQPDPQCQIHRALVNLQVVPHRHLTDAAGASWLSGINQYSYFPDLLHSNLNGLRSPDLTDSNNYFFI